eukprot:Transcript_26416.p1 GENE.Transcript_26416~~Transcript_26416.p1  ORF type:complete len:517 (-),score=143.23 Transcript_26416:275-1825(-)
MLALRAGPSARSPGGLDDTTLWCPHDAADAGKDTYFQPSLPKGVDATQVEVWADTLTQAQYTHGRCPITPSSSVEPLQSVEGEGCLNLVMFGVNGDQYRELSSVSPASEPTPVQVRTSDQQTAQRARSRVETGTAHGKCRRLEMTERRLEPWQQVELSRFKLYLPNLLNAAAGNRPVARQGEDEPPTSSDEDEEGEDGDEAAAPAPPAPRRCLNPAKKEKAAPVMRAAAEVPEGLEAGSASSFAAAKPAQHKRKPNEGEQPAPRGVASAAWRAEQPGAKRPWSKEDDRLLCDHVAKYGPHKMVGVVPGRSATSCTDRWKQVLDPSVKKGEWTEEEDETIMRAVKELGTKKWATIRKSYLPCRSNTGIRNRYYAAMRKREREQKPAEEETNLLEEPMCEWYVRCACMPKDADILDNSDLIDGSGAKCTHTVAGSALIAKLKKRQLDNNQTLYKKLKGQSRSDEPIWKTINKLKMGGLRMKTTERDSSVGRNVLYGLLSRSATPFTLAAGQSSGQFSD